MLPRNIRKVFRTLKGGEVLKLAGLGLKNLVLVSLFVIVFIVMLKTILIKHPIAGVTEVVSAV